MPGWQGSNRRHELPPDWAVTTKRILDRDRHQCQHIRADTGRICGLFATDVDHVGDKHDDRDINLRALCPWHHLRRSGAQGGKASGAARRAKRDAVKPLHPGLVTRADRDAQRRNEQPPPF